MKKQLAFFACALVSTMLTSQSVPTALQSWTTIDGSQNFFYKNVTKTDGQSNVYVAGGTINGNGDVDILVAKYNSAGVQQWIKQIPGIGNGPDFAAGLFVTSSAAYITGAITNNTATPETDVVTMKLSASTGSVVWSTTYAGAGGYIDAGKFITVSGSDVYVTGEAYNSSFNADYVTLKYNESTGSQTWVNILDYSVKKLIID